ncbi:MAG: hypothetical protein ACREMH_00160 [Gemmatimonadales bacterium]
MNRLPSPRTLAFAAAGLALAACASGGGSPEAAEPAIAPVALPPVRVPEDRPFALTAAVRGDALLELAAGTVRGRRDTTAAFGAVLELADTRAGDERSKACGREWRGSEARASASVAPKKVEGTGVTEVTLAATARATAGFYREKGVLTCTQRKESPATASARARFRMAIALSAGEGVRDRVMLQINGQPFSRLNLTLADSAGRQLPLEAAPSGGATGELPGPGAYVLGGWLQSTDGSRRATLRLLSLRDALTAAYGGPPTPGLLIPFDVSLDARELSASLTQAVTGGPEGWRPCPNRCTGRGEDLLVTGARVAPAGGGVRVTLQFSGARDTVSYLADLEGQGDSLRFANITLAAGSIDRRNLTAANVTLQDRLAGARLGVGERLTAASREVEAKLPVAWGPACVVRGEGPPVYRGLRPPSDPELLTAAYGLGVAGPVACPRPAPAQR